MGEKVRSLSTGRMGRIVRRSDDDRHWFVVDTSLGRQQWPDWDIYSFGPWWWPLRHPFRWVAARRERGW